MSKKRKIIMALGVLVVGVFVGILVIGTLGYVLLSRNRSGIVTTSGPTQIGVPNGPAATKSIGPAGGSIASIDGRITVNVPPNDILVPVEFVVTPITNQAPGGLGNAYRLEPNGQKFTTPVEISFNYSEQDGATPDALMASYQEQGGGWTLLTNQKMDDAGKSL